MKRVLRSLVCAFVMFLPITALALPQAPVNPGPYTVPNALLDAVTPAGATQSQLSSQGLQPYTLTFHDANYSYTLPVCSSATIEDTSGARYTSAGSLVAGDNLVVSIGPNPYNTGPTCITAVVIELMDRQSNGTDCLQNYEVTHAVAPDVKTLLPNVTYTFTLTVYTRPTLACDSGAYGSTPITTNLATGTAFLVTVMQSANQLGQLTATTNASGIANFNYKFSSTGSYTFQVSPATDQAPGNVISWSESVALATPSTSPVPPSAHSATPPPAPKHVSMWLALAVAAAFCLVFAIVGLILWLRHKRKLAARLPEEEYLDAPKL